MRGDSFNTIEILRAWWEEVFETYPGDIYQRDIDNFVECWIEVAFNKVKYIID